MRKGKMQRSPRVLHSSKREKVVLTQMLVVRTG